MKRGIRYHKQTIAMLSLGLVAYGLFFLLHPTDPQSAVLTAIDEQPEIYFNDTTQLTLTIPQELKESEVSPEEYSQGIIGRLVSENFTDSSLDITVRIQGDILPATGPQNKQALSTATEDIKNEFSDRYPGFRLEKNNDRLFDGREGVDLEISYENPSGSEDRVSRRLIVIQTDDDQVVSIDMQTFGNDFETVNEEVFGFMSQTIVFGTGTINAYDEVIQN